MQPLVRWFGLWAIVLGVALALRCTALENRPMHADEAVQASITRQLWWKGSYRYNPDEFHGPTLAYASLGALAIERPSNFAATTPVTYRIVPALFGAALILAVAMLGDGLGRWAAWAAGGMLAISPSLVFYSRYYIHEMLLAAFSLATVAVAWRYLKTRRLGWCLAAGVFLGLMQATKETAVLTYLGWAVGAALTIGWEKITGSRDASPFSEAPAEQVLREADNARSIAVIWLLVMGVAALVAAGLYSSLLANPRGPMDAVLTYLPWIGRAQGHSPHVHAWYYYLQILGWWRAGEGPVWSEAAILILALVGFVSGVRGSAALLTGASPRLVRYLGFSTAALILIYSTIPYKTPWCLVQFHIGLVLLAGVGAVAAVRLVRGGIPRGMVILVLVLAAAHLAWQTYRSSFLMPADPQNPYAYVPTLPDAERLERDIEELALASPEEYAVPVKVIWNNTYYWPLPWYLRRLERVGFWAQIPDDPSAAIVVAAPEHDTALTARLDATHLMTGFYGLRPGVLAQLWVRMDLWEAHLRRLGRIE